MKKIAVFTSGGDAPGMNACIRAVARTAISQNLEVFGIVRGYEGMIAGDFKKLESTSVSNIIQRGGTILKSARSKEFRTKAGRNKAYDHLIRHHIDGVVAIGGDGTFTGAQVFSEEFEIPFIGIPGTIDNDLYGTDFTIGYDTAINTVIEAVDKIRDTADAHDRLFFVEVMGRDAGFIALRAGIGAGAESILIPETKTDIGELVERLKVRESKKRNSSIIIIAEGDDAGGAYQIAEKVEEIHPQFKTKVTILGHLQRGGSPSAMDRVLASQLGKAAVEALLNKQSNVMVGVINKKVHFTSFSKSIKHHQEINSELLNLAEMLAK